MKIETPISKEPSGGPIKLLVKDSADHIRPLAFSRFSSATTLGIKVCALLSLRTSAKPNKKEVRIKVRYRAQFVSKSVIELSSFREGSESLFNKTTTPTMMVKTPRKRSIPRISFRRSNRSVITPACKVNTSHGRRDAKPAAAINTGDLVTADASHG